MIRYLPLLLVLLELTACGRQSDSVLEQVQKQGELVVLTRISPTTYYEGPEGPTGLEYDLASLFAERLGVELRMVVPRNFNELIPLVASRRFHMAAAGLTVTEDRKSLVRFGPSYQTIRAQLVYRSGNGRPMDLNQLKGRLEVVAGSSHVELLSKLRQEHPNLSWHENGRVESEQLLSRVWAQTIDYTIADSNELGINQRFYPELRVAMDISEPQPLAWAFPIYEDTSLYDEAVDFFEEITESGKLRQLIDRHYGHVERLDYVGTRRYMRHIEERLPEFRPLFQAAAEATDQDWRLLAAMGYQESHWDPGARSPTGVRGIMMLTLNTMRQLGLDNRLDPEQSIMGGARYIRQIKDRLPERINEPDRTWLALAAYNVGMGHLEDARILTARNGGNPDKWVSVKRYLPLLSQKKWYEKTRYGFARGHEPVQYVENIRSYFDILVWQTMETRIPDIMPPNYDFLPPAI
jgi:membrane-bound lytic murein transglycosylase F